MEKTISDAWIKEKNDFLKENLPEDIKGILFYPDNDFYAYYYSDNLKGLHYMAMQLFDWLNIKPNGCSVDFYDSKDFKTMGDAAGFYTKVKDENGEEKEVILINSKHKSDAFGVGAILAHEMMHLYLIRLGLELEDLQENELMTDLATINTGLSILILNGMSYSSEWFSSIIALMFGFIYWRSQQLAFGYFNPKQYGKHAADYFKENNVMLENVFGFMNPSSRYFIPHTLIKSKNPTPLIKFLEKRRLKGNLTKIGILVIVITGLMFYNNYDNRNNSSRGSQSTLTSKQSALATQIDVCKIILGSIETDINNDQNNLQSMENRLNIMQASGNIDQYNQLVDPHNSLVLKIKLEASSYDKKLAECNGLVDQYNASIK